MKSIIALVLFIACAAQVHSACVNTNQLYKSYGHVPHYDLHNYHSSLEFYPHGVYTHGHYPVRSCNCGSCASCTGNFYPAHFPYFLH
uniref:Uncharacterized protein n=1 Tax=Anopheles stephensi TaxID=30069 RepID=A0A182YJ71_ANOST